MTMLERRPIARPASQGPTHRICPLVGIGGALRDQHECWPPWPTRAHEREVAAVTSHHLDHERSLVARCSALDRVDRFGDPVQCRVGADRHVGAEHVIVDRADQADDRQAGWASARARSSSPRSTNSSSSSDHSVRKMSAPVRLPSPPMITNVSMPCSTRLRAA